MANSQYPQSQPTRVTPGPNSGQPYGQGGYGNYGGQGGYNNSGYNNGGYNNGGYNNGGYNNNGRNNNKGNGQNMIVILVLAIIAIVATGVAVYFIVKSGNESEKVEKLASKEGDDAIEFDTDVPVDDKESAKSSSAKPASNTQYSWLSERKLTNSDVSGLSTEEMRILRNAIYAKYGYKFKSPDLQEHFGQFSWYKGVEPNEGKVYKRMTSIEKSNIEFLKNKENGKGGGGGYTAAPSGSMSYLTSRKIGYNDIAGKSQDELRIMRNYIYAVHGYKFKSADLQRYFGQFSWYTPLYSDVSGQLSSIEKFNVQFIKSYEN